MTGAPLAFAASLLLTATSPVEVGVDVGLGLGKVSPAPVGGCPADARVEVNLAAWRASLEQADSDKRRDDLLAQVKVTLDASDNEPDPRAPRLVLNGVEDAAVQLEPGARADHVLQIRYRPEGADEAATIRLVQVLRPLGNRTFCALGTDLSPPSAVLSYGLSFVSLVSASAKVIQIRSVRAQPRESETRLEYWTARGFKLHKVFDRTLELMRSDEGGGATTTSVATVALTGGFPKQIDLTEVTKRGGCEVRAGDTPCEDGAPTSTKATFVFDGTRYVRRR